MKLVEQLWLSSKRLQKEHLYGDLVVAGNDLLLKTMPWLEFNLSYLAPQEHQGPQRQKGKLFDEILVHLTPQSDVSVFDTDF